MDVENLVKQYAATDKLHIPDQQIQYTNRDTKRPKRTNIQYTPTDATKIGKYVAIDCEMVGVGQGGLVSALARVSIVNFHGHVLLDEYVRPQERIVDYRTEFSGIRPHHMVHAKSMLEVQRLVDAQIKGKIVVGHSLQSDFGALMLSHPKNMRRDTAMYSPFRKQYGNGRTPGLKVLVRELLGRDIQTGKQMEGHNGHSSIEDARAVMELFRSVKPEWEAKLVRKQRRSIGTKSQN